MLVTVQEYIRRAYGPDSRPSVRTMRKWLHDRDFPYPVVKKGRAYYIDLSTPKTTNRLISKVLTA